MHLSRVLKWLVGLKQSVVLEGRISLKMEVLNLMKSVSIVTLFLKIKGISNNRTSKKMYVSSYKAGKSG